MVKHVRLSELHKNNVAALRRTLSLEHAQPQVEAEALNTPSQFDPSAVTGPARYRDRAKERREKVGSDVLKREYDLSDASETDSLATHSRTDYELGTLPFAL